MKTKYMPLGIAFLVVLLFAGCLLTGTVIVTAKLAPDSAGNPITISNTSYSGGEIEVNLDNDADFEDYKDNIKNIDNIGFYMEVTNNGFNPVTVQLFLEPDLTKNWSTPEMPVDSGSYLIFTGFTIPGRTAGPIKKTVTWEQSKEYITGLADIKPYLEKGVFSIYPNIVPRDNFNVTIDSLVVIITLSGEK